MRILSINLWNTNEPLIERMDKLSQYISVEKPDVICFQEVSKINGNLQINDMLRANGYDFIYESSGTWQSREEGLSIATFHPILFSKVFRLPKENSYNDMERILCMASLKINGKTIDIYNTHLAYHKLSSQCRLSQMRYISQIVAKESQNKCCVVCGDFNLFLDDIDERAYLFEQMRKCNVHPTIDPFDFGLTFDSKNGYVSSDLWPNRTIDYIFASNELMLRSTLCMCFTDGFHPCSDHYGVLARGIV